MSVNARVTAPLIAWGMAQAVLAGQTVSGDRHLVSPCRDGLLVAVVDGLGHGEEAAKAAEIAVSTLGSRDLLHGWFTARLLVRAHSSRIAETDREPHL